MVTYKMALNALVAVALVLSLVAFFDVGEAQANTPTPPVLFESMNTGGDGDSQPIAIGNQTSQQFYSGTESHSVSSVRVWLQKVGDPDYVTLQVATATDPDSVSPLGNTSTGVILASVTIEDLVIPEGSYSPVEFDLSGEGLALEANTSYVLIISSPYAGTLTDYILWEKDSGGGSANTMGANSTDAGLNWVTDKPADYLFEVWGRVSMHIHDVKVFASFKEDDDWLFTIYYDNTYSPYYENKDAIASYFNFQLVNLANVTVAQTSVRMWDYRPGSIYLSASDAATLEWGSLYTIRMTGNFGTQPYVDYVLSLTDWTGDEMSLLDTWVISQAEKIAEEDEVLMTTVVAGVGEVLNSRGQTIFATGIPYLTTARPDLMEMAVLKPAPTDNTHTVTTTDMETELGTDVKTFLDDGRGFLGVDDAETVGVLIFMVVCAVILAAAAVMGHLLTGAGLCYVGLLVTTMTGVTDWAVLGIVTFGAFVVWIFLNFANK